MNMILAVCAQIAARLLRPVAESPQNRSNRPNLQCRIPFQRRCLSITTKLTGRSSLCVLAWYHSHDREGLVTLSLLSL